MSVEPRQAALADDLIEAIRLAVVGIDGRTEPHPCLANPLAAAAFRWGSTKTPVHAGPGLWAVLRTSADHTGQVLCVHNVSDEPQGFLPGQHLGKTAPVFLRGETATVETAGGLRCELKPSRFVWLGLFTPPTGETER